MPGGGGYDYYFFCDQDDIWDKNKIEKMVNEAEKFAYDRVPLMVHGNMRLLDRNGRVTDEDFNKTYNMCVKNPMVDAFFSHRIPGCNMMLNNKCFVLLRRMMNDDEYHSMGHDTFAAKVCAAYNGRIIYLNEPLMGYRRYEGSVTAEQSFEISLMRIIKRVANFQKLAEDLSYLYWCSILSAYLLLKQDDLPNRLVIQDVIDALKKGGVRTIRLWLKYKIDCGSKVRTCSHFLVLLSGQYKKYYRYKLPD